MMTLLVLPQCTTALNYHVHHPFHTAVYQSPHHRPINCICCHKLNLNIHCISYTVYNDRLHGGPHDPTGCGWGRTWDLVEVVDQVCTCRRLGFNTRFAVVQAHIKIYVNERADLIANARCRASLLPQDMQSGMRAKWKDIQSTAKMKAGLGV